MRRGAETRNLGRVRDDLLEPVGAEGPEADGRRAVDAPERPVHVVVVVVVPRLGPGGCRCCGDQWGGFIGHCFFCYVESFQGRAEESGNNEIVSKKGEWNT